MDNNKIHYGSVKFYNKGRNYGFIIERETNNEYFVCMTSLIDHIKAGSEVSFKLFDDLKGPMAVDVRLINRTTLKLRHNEKKNGII